MLAEIETRIRAQMPELKQIGRAGDLANAMRDLKQSPAAFILPGELRPHAPRTMPMRQMVERGVVIMLGLTATGPKGLDALDDLEPAVTRAMLGWRHPDAKGGFHMTGGGIARLDLKLGLLFYQLRWAAPFYIQEDPNA